MFEISNNLSRIVLGVEYNGKNYLGWQKQNYSEQTLQAQIELAIKEIAGEQINIVAAGRTDRGVHALQQVIHFDSEVKRPISAWVRGVNDKLSNDISILWAKELNNLFHARFSAISRRYRYVLLQRSERPGLLQGKVGWCRYKLNVEAMQRASKFLIGEHDFSSFRSVQCQAKNPVRNMTYVKISQNNDLICFDFTANAFLHHMVRNLVGSLVAIGLNKYPADWILSLIAMKDRKEAPPTFSADGLYFVGPQYADEWQISQIQLVDFQDIY